MKNLLFCIALLTTTLLAEEQRHDLDTILAKTPCTAEVVSMPTLHTINNTNVITIMIYTEDGMQSLQVKAMDIPLLLWVRPGDNLDMITSRINGQITVISVNIINQNGNKITFKTSNIETIKKVNCNNDILTIVTTNDETYKLDKTMSSPWCDNIHIGDRLKFESLQRDSGNWVSCITQHKYDRLQEFHNTFCDSVIVTNITIKQYWYYITTNQPNIRFEVDSRMAPDVRSQQIGAPPIFHYEYPKWCYDGIGVLGSCHGHHGCDHHHGYNHHHGCGHHHGHCR